MTLDAGADAALARLGGPSVAQILDGDRDAVVEQLRSVLSPASQLFTDRSRQAAAAFEKAHPEHTDSATAVDALVQAMTYLFAASWPGWTTRRLTAYAKSNRVFDILIRTFAPAMGIDVDTFRIQINGDQIVGYAIVPAGVDRAPAILMTNGLEGTIAEIALPALRHRPADAAVFIMEMPGTFAYRNPLSLDSENYYRAVIDHMASHPRIDSDRLAMHGTSFGAHWSTRMATRDKRLKAVVSNGGLYHHAFKSASTFGMPEIMLWTLEKTLAAKNPMDLARKLGAFSVQDAFGDIAMPILAVNGDSDTLVPTRDTVELAHAAPKGELKLYPDDDHCAMAHYDEAFADAIAWIAPYLDIALSTSNETSES
ncbi:alpha/beta hydrolase family protein [Gordonia aichiensis]